MTKDELLEHIMTFYSDTSRSREETKDALEDVAAQIEMLVDTLDD